MRFDEYRRYDGLGLAELIANREILASEALEAALSRADEVGSKLNAIVTRMDASARQRAAAGPTGLFGGVPFLVKDLAQEQEGVLCSYGCQGLKERGYAPPYTAEIVARWLKAGFVIFGRTNAPEFGLSTRDRAPRLGAGAKPLGPRALARRFLRRLGRGGRRGHSSARRRQRPRRLDSHPRLGVRPVRLQAGPRANALGPRARRDDARRGGQSCDHALGARQRGAARCDDGSGARFAVRRRAARKTVSLGDSQATDRG